MPARTSTLEQADRQEFNREGHEVWQVIMAYYNPVALFALRERERERERDELWHITCLLFSTCKLVTLFIIMLSPPPPQEWITRLCSLPWRRCVMRAWTRCVPLQTCRTQRRPSGWSPPLCRSRSTAALCSLWWRASPPSSTATTLSRRRPPMATGR